MGNAIMSTVSTFHKTMCLQPR